MRTAGPNFAIRIPLLKSHIRRPLTIFPFLFIKSSRRRHQFSHFLFSVFIIIISYCVPLLCTTATTIPSQSFNCCKIAWISFHL